MSDSPAASDSTASQAFSTVETDASCRLPLLLLFGSTAIWLLIGSAFALISSIKFHAPTFLADTPWLTYGRVHPAYLNAMLYGFCVQAGLGTALWLLARLGGVPLAQPVTVTFGAILWNLGATVGMVGILAGDSTGFEALEMPRYAVMMLAVGYLMIGIGGVFTFHRRRQKQLFVSQWFLFAALFWFPWIYSTAELLLVLYPVRGITQSVIAWWYGHNLQFVWLWLVGLGTVFYLVPKLTNRELNSRYLALFTFWMLILFGSWGGIPSSAPVPAWLPAMSTVSAVLTLIPLLSVALSVYSTAGRVMPDRAAPLALKFIWVGVIAFFLAGLMRGASFLPGVSRFLDLTWFTAAQMQLNFYGFFAFVMFGAIYYSMPRLTGIDFPFPALVRAHFWLALVGIALIAVPFAVAGVVEGAKLQKASIPFLDVMKASLPFLRVSTVGDLALALGHLLLAVNFFGLLIRFSRFQAVAAYQTATEDLLKPAGVGA